MLLRYAPKPASGGEILDLGCGYGPIAVTMALRSPDARIWAVDVDDMALELTELNVKRLGISNVVCCTPREVPEGTRFSQIYSNPPIRIGKPAMRWLVLKWIQRLQVDARAYLVVKKTMGADALMSWVDEHGYPTIRLRSKQGYRLLEVQRA